MQNCLSDLSLITIERVAAAGTLVDEKRDLEWNPSVIAVLKVRRLRKGQIDTSFFQIQSNPNQYSSRDKSSLLGWFLN
jgi:hypothetical protein